MVFNVFLANGNLNRFFLDVSMCFRRRSYKKSLSVICYEDNTKKIGAYSSNALENRKIMVITLQKAF